MPPFTRVLETKKPRRPNEGQRSELCEPWLSRRVPDAATPLSNDVHIFGFVLSLQCVHFRLSKMYRQPQQPSLGVGLNSLF